MKRGPFTARQAWKIKDIMFVARVDIPPQWIKKGDIFRCYNWFIAGVDGFSFADPNYFEPYFNPFTRRYFER